MNKTKLVLKKLLLTVVFVAIAMGTGAAISVYKTDKDLVEAKVPSQIESVETGTHMHNGEYCYPHRVNNGHHQSGHGHGHH